MTIDDINKYNRREEMWHLMCMYEEHPEWNIFTIDSVGYFATNRRRR